MLKLRRYLKPYAGLLLMAVLLLFGQAMLELSLPNYMSDIVNVGLQQGGITEAAPHAVQAEDLAMMERFMTEEDRTLIQGQYELLSNQKELEKLRHTFPGLENTDFILKKDAPQETNLAFSRASYAIIKMMEDLMQGQVPVEPQEKTAELDMAALGKLSEMLQVPGLEEKAAAAVQLASETPDSVLGQTGVVFTKAFYKGLGADTDKIQIHYILKVGLQMLGLTVMLTVCVIGASFCLSRLGAGVGRDLRRDVFRKVSYFNSREMDKFSGASLITRSTNDVTQIQNFLSMGMRVLCYAPIMGIGGLVMGLSTSLNLAWLMALALILMLGIILVMFAVAMPRFKKMQKYIDRLNLVSREELGGMMVVRAFANQPFMQDRFDKASRDLTGNTLFVNRAMTTMMPFMTLVLNMISLMIVWFGGKQIAASSLQVGDMMAFIQYAMQVIMSFLFISMMFIMVPRASVSADRVNEILETENAVSDPEHPAMPKDGIKGTVEFRDVSFHYEGADSDVLEHISFTARPGETTAFIGSTGSGKTTLVNLIPRFYDATAGEILVDGIDVRKYAQKDLREAIGYVPQKGLLFSGTVASNLRYGDEQANEDQLKTAAEIAQATEFIDNLPDRYDTRISQGGTNVSGGQRQRLSIARALVKKAPIYIFDDTFSALDFKTDAALRKALKGYTENAAVLIVAQRVSTIMHAEQIVVLDEGKVAGIGTHEELLKNCPTYREIAESQLSKEELA